MPNINPGDSVTSDRYGPGKVTSVASVPGCVDVSFECGEVDAIYSAYTGKRHLQIGSDRISAEVAE